MFSVIPDLLARRAGLTPHKVALEDGLTGRCLTYADLDRRASRAASLMRARGVGPGDRVAILCRNRFAFFEILFGCARLGAILVPLNWRMPAWELNLMVEDAAPGLLFFDDSDADAATRLGLPSIGLDDDYEALLEAQPEGEWRARWPADDIWYLIYTSGTTGRPKGVIYNFRMAVANHVNIGTAIDLRSTDTTLNFLPLFHTAGINLHTLPTLFAGGRVIVLPGFEEKAVLRLLGERRIDTFFAVPAVYQALLAQPRFRAVPLDAVRHWGSGGAPLADSVAEACRALGIRVCNGMGMTETGPTAFLADPADAWSRIGSVGKPRLLCSVRIVDEEGTDVRDGRVGDLLFAGPGVTPGYWNDEEATRAAFTDDGWLRSGDLALRDSDGFYYIVGRRKEMFISGGENVYPAEVENILASHPSVAEVAVIPWPDERWGEVARAYVLPVADSRPGAEELQAFCRARLAAYKVPRSFQLVTDFPRTAAGKIRKSGLVTTSGSPAEEDLREAG